LRKVKILALDLLGNLPWIEKRGFFSSGKDDNESGLTLGEEEDAAWRKKDRFAAAPSF